MQAELHAAAALVAAHLPHHIELSIRHNPWRGDYKTVEEWLEIATTYEGLELGAGDRAAIVAAGEAWEITWYPETPVGSCTVAAASLARALELALAP